jgi:hypothetical protein
VQTGEFVLGGDHELSNTMSLGVRYVHKWMFRTIEDVGLNLPGIGEAYLIANPGFGYTEVMDPSFPQFKTPKAKRNYDAMELRLRKRFSNRWSAEVDYTFSRLYGNYGGLASSDENGRTSPNVNRYFDALYMSYDDKQQAVYGSLATDRPHVAKVNATYDLPWGTSLGGFFIVQSGLPQTSEFTYQGYPIYANGRNDLGRLPIFKQFDLQAQHEFRLGGNRRISLLANIVNVLDLKTVTYYYGVNPYRTGVTPPSGVGDHLFWDQPWTPQQLVALSRSRGATIKDQVWYMTPNTFQAPREIRFQVKFSF